jgi:hypothetical protein
MYVDCCARFVPTHIPHLLGMLACGPRSSETFYFVSVTNSSRVRILKSGPTRSDRIQRRPRLYRFRLGKIEGDCACLRTSIVFCHLALEGFRGGSATECIPLPMMRTIDAVTQRAGSKPGPSRSTMYTRRCLVESLLKGI